MHRRRSPTLHEEGLQVRPGGPLVPRLRRLRDPHAVQQVVARARHPAREDRVRVGIGCSSRFPYYMNTYGFHTIHGRAPAVATGIKIARTPSSRSGWSPATATALSIGGNHMIHVLRRNVDVKILLFNNQIYGLTKGQYSPTSRDRARRRSRRRCGSVDQPFNPICARARRRARRSSRARSTRTWQHLKDGAQARRARTRARRSSRSTRTATSSTTARFETFAEKDVRDDNTIELEHGKPLVFGKATGPGHPHRTASTSRW